MATQVTDKDADVAPTSQDCSQLVTSGQNHSLTASQIVPNNENASKESGDSAVINSHSHEPSGEASTNGNRDDVTDSAASGAGRKDEGNDCEEGNEENLPLLGGSASARRAENAVTYNWVDVTEQFVSDCAQLELGQLLHDDMFGLFEGMSAVEMMDPKMDAGMVCNQTKRKVSRPIGCV